MATTLIGCEWWCWCSSSWCSCWWLLLSQGGEGASARKISPASYVQVRHFPVPARSLLVAALNRAFGIGLYETECVRLPGVAI